MAEKMRCKICGFTSVRCGMSGHFRVRHPEIYNNITERFDAMESLGWESNEERKARLEKRMGKP